MYNGYVILGAGFTFPDTSKVVPDASDLYCTSVDVM
jgi:hypothetical protein